MDERRLSILGHLEELRGRLIVSLIAVALGTAASLVFAKQIFGILLRPAGDVEVIFIEVTEMLGAYMQVGLTGGLVIASPVVLYEMVMFVAPGLIPKERRYLYILLPSSVVAFVAGAIFCYLVLLPPALGFLLGIGADVATPQIRIGNYIATVSRLIVAVGVVFETPLIIWFLARIGIVSPRLLAHYRRHAYVVAFVLGAIITPTFDPINQSLIAVPIIILYEVGILLAHLAYRRRA